MTTWEKVYFQNGQDVIFGGGSECFISRPSNRFFLSIAGEKAWAYIKDNEVLLFYNYETGDHYIPGPRTPEEVKKIKEEFLKFIARDTHEELFKDVTYREVSI